MKRLFCTLLFSLTFLLSFTQSRLSTDSIRFYQKQLNQLYLKAFDSVRNSEQYKFLTEKLKSKADVENFGVELIFILGVQFNQYTNLNARLSSLGLKEINSSAGLFGVGLSFRFNKVIVGYDMNLLIGDNGSGGYLHGFVSTNVIKTKRFIFSPQVGYGGQTITHRYKTQSSATDFNSYFITSPNKVEIHHSSSVLDLAMALKLYPRSNNDNYVSVFRIGDRHGLKAQMWEITNGNSPGAPYDRNSNFYVQLVIGVGN